MTRLRHYERDRELPRTVGDHDLVPPSGAEFAAWVQERLTRPGSPGVRGAELGFVRWKPRVGITASYAVEFTDGESRWASLRRYSGAKGEHAAATFQPDEHERAGCDRLLPFAVDAATGALAYGFPADRELRGIGRLLDMQRTIRFLKQRRTFGDEDLRWTRSSADVLRYKPERRAVVALDLVTRHESGGGVHRTRRRIGARVLPVAHAARVAALRTRLEGESAATREVRMPRLLAHDEAAGILFEEWLDATIAAPDDFAAAYDAGRAIGVLQGVSVMDAPTAYANSRQPLADLFAVDARLTAAFARLEFAPPEAAPCLVHGDFHPDQVGRSREDGRIVVLDLDEVGTGTRVDDAASWIADQLAASPGTDFEAASHPLLAGIASVAGAELDPLSLRRAARRELIARAAARLRRLERGAIDKAHALLERARDLAAADRS